MIDFARLGAIALDMGMTLEAFGRMKPGAFHDLFEAYKPIFNMKAARQGWKLQEKEVSVLDL